MSLQDIPIEFFGHRNIAADVAVILLFLVVYGLLAAMLVGRILRRYPVEEGWAVTLMMIALASLAFGFGGMLVGELWSAGAENIRLRDLHLAGRFGSLPWVRHESVFLILCVVLFWGAAVARFRVRQHGK